MSELKISEFDNRNPDGKPDEAFGYLCFSDGLRIGYAPGARGVDDWGLFIPEQPYKSRHLELAPHHITAARAFVDELRKLQPQPQQQPV